MLQFHLGLVLAISLEDGENLLWMNMVALFMEMFSVYNNQSLLIMRRNPLTGANIGGTLRKKRKRKRRRKKKWMKRSLRMALSRLTAFPVLLLGLKHLMSLIFENNNGRNLRNLCIKFLKKRKSALHQELCLELLIHMCLAQRIKRGLNGLIFFVVRNLTKLTSHFDRKNWKPLMITLAAKYEEAREEEKMRNQREDFSDMVAEVEKKRKRKMQEKEGKSKKQKDFKF
uniref:Uncharacterized protein n=1 Tax=Picea sitchensis TaxID=3332 RepID=D5AAL0_PICSI|nr:unknown [Picea sitchensis]